MVRLAAIAKGFEASNNAAYGQGSFWQATAEHAREFIHFYDNRWSMWIAFGWLVQLSLTMLLGLLAGRERWVQRIPALRPQLRRYSLWALAQGPGLRRGVHDDCRVQPGARAVTDQVAGRRVLLDQPAGDDDLLRADHRAAGAAAGLAAAVGTLCCGRPHAADQLPDADGAVHHLVLRAGASACGAGSGRPPACCWRCCCSSRCRCRPAAGGCGSTSAARWRPCGPG